MSGLCCGYAHFFPVISSLLVLLRLRSRVRAANQDDLGQTRQDALGANQRRAGARPGKDVLPAAQSDHIGQQVISIQRVLRGMPDLQKNAHGVGLRWGQECLEAVGQRAHPQTRRVSTTQELS